MKKDKIKEIIKVSKSLDSYEKKLDYLHNKFKDETCYVLGCGPSLKDVDKDKLIDESKNNCLFTIKQSYFSFKDHVDFHFFNSNNYINYPNNTNAFFIGSSDFASEGNIRSTIWKNQQVDICTSVVGNKPLGTRRYDKNFEGLGPHTFKNSALRRHWGAGIMFENVLFFAMHLGFNKIKTVGWDYIDVSNGQKELVHFYKESERQKLRNPADPPYEAEMKESIELAGLFADFFKQHGIILECHESGECFLPNNIVRYKL